MQQAYSDLLLFSDGTAVTLRAATGQQGGKTGSRDVAKGCLLLLHPFGQLQGLSVCGNSTFLKHVNKDFYEF